MRADPRTPSSSTSLTTHAFGSVSVITLSRGMASHSIAYIPLDKATCKYEKAQAEPAARRHLSIGAVQAVRDQDYRSTSITRRMSAILACNSM